MLRRSRAMLVPVVLSLVLSSASAAFAVEPDPDPDLGPIPGPVVVIDDGQAFSSTTTFYPGDEFCTDVLGVQRLPYHIRIDVITNLGPPTWHAPKARVVIWRASNSGFTDAFKAFKDKVTGENAVNVTYSGQRWFQICITYPLAQHNIFANPNNDWMDIEILIT